MSAANLREFDIALTPVKSRGDGVLRIHLPAAITRALVAKGYNRASVSVTDEGILVRPYVADESRPGSAFAIPEWGKP